MDEDPAFYTKFSKLIKDTIEAFKNKRISDAEYLEKVKSAMHSIKNRTDRDLPIRLDQKDIAKAFYGVTFEIIKKIPNNSIDLKELSADIALKIDETILERKIVDWLNKQDIQNKMIGDIEDYLWEIKSEHNIDLTFDDIDLIIEKTMNIAKLRYAE